MLSSTTLTKRAALLFIDRCKMARQWPAMGHYLEKQRVVPSADSVRRFLADKGADYEKSGENVSPEWRNDPHIMEYACRDQELSLPYLQERHSEIHVERIASYCRAARLLHVAKHRQGLKRKFGYALVTAMGWPGIGNRAEKTEEH